MEISAFRFAISPSHQGRTPRSVGLGVCLAGALLWGAPRIARADDAVAYKYADYREAGGRIAVQTQSALVEQDLGTDTKLKLQGVIDAIAGATPTGEPAPAGSDQVPLQDMTDRRRAWSLDLSRQFSPVNLDLGYANSRESDYVSNGWSLNTLTDFNRKNTTLLVGVAGTADDVKVTYQKPWMHKRTRDVIVGLTQLLDPHTAFTANLTFGRASGFLNDQYKVVMKTVEIYPGLFLPQLFLENRPGSRSRFIAFAGLNHDFSELHGALEASGRYYHDTFGIGAWTLEASWLQHAGPKVVLQPLLRFYQQTAARFYYYALDATSIVPPSGFPPAQGPFYSSDYRLSALRTSTMGLKVVWTVASRLQFDLEWDDYRMSGRDSVTPGSAYPHASIVTAGARISW